MPAKTTAAVMDDARKQLQQATDFKSQLLKQYMGEPQVPIYLSPMYRPYFGNIMQVAMNGITIAFPVDGSTRNVPQTFADEITRRRMAIDAQLTKQHRMTDIKSNAEGAPGELALF
jgi:hypothetical protein